MGVIYNFLVNNFSAKEKAKKAYKKLFLKENDFVFSLNDFSSALSFSQLKNTFGLFNIPDFFTLQENMIYEYELLSRRVTDDLYQKLDENKVVVSFSFTFIKDGIFILSFPSKINFKDKALFQQELYKKMLLLFIANNSKKSFDQVINTHFVERDNQQIQKSFDLIDCRNDLVSFIIDTVKSSKN